jgi:hypothetical protein
VRIKHGGALPDLARMKVNLYGGAAGRGTATERLADLIRLAYRSGSRGQEDAASVSATALGSEIANWAVQPQVAAFDSKA